MLLPRLLLVLALAFALLSLAVGPRRAWHAWMRLGRIAGDLVAAVVLTIFYFTILAPFAAIVALRLDPLGVEPHRGRWWVPHAAPAPDLESARRQSGLPAPE